MWGPVQSRTQASRVSALVFLATCCGCWRVRADDLPNEPELFPGRTIAHCAVTERAATREDIPLTSRIPVLLAEPADWKDVAGPHGERAVSWQTGRNHGYRLLDPRGRVLHDLSHVSLPRWSPDGRWLAVSRWSSRELPYQLALVEVRTGRITPIPKVNYFGSGAWSPDSRKLAFVGRRYVSSDHSSIGWLSIPDTAVHEVAADFNDEFECEEMAWSADSRRFVALMHREYEHDDVRVTDLWLFGLEQGVCRLTATPHAEESNISWLDDRHLIFQAGPSGSDAAQSGFGTVLELPVLQNSRH